MATTASRSRRGPAQFRAGSASVTTGLILAGALVLTGTASSAAEPAPGDRAEHAAVPPAAAVAAPAETPLALAVTTPTERFALGDHVPLTAVVTNRTGTTCALATSPDASLRVVGVTRDGTDVRPELTHAWVDGTVAYGVEGSLEEVAPDGSVELLRTIDPLTTDDPALRDIDALPSGDALVSSWPVDEPGRYEVALRYEVLPLETQPFETGLPASAPPCAGSSGVATVAFVVGGGGEDDAAAAGPEDASRFPWLVVLVLVVAVAGGALWWVRRRGRGRAGTSAADNAAPGPGAGPGPGTGPGAGPGPGAAAGLVVVLALGGTLLPAPSAQALLVYAPGQPEGFAEAAQACIAAIRAANHSPETQRIIDWADDPSSDRVLIIYDPHTASAHPTPHTRGGPGSSTIAWNPDSTRTFEPGVPRDPCSSLFHELAHAYAIGDGTAKPRTDMCADTGIPEEEVRATFLENVFRSLNGLPPRTHYGPRPLPSSLAECDRPTRIPYGPERIGSDLPEWYCEGSADESCAESNGDPHVRTFDGRRFSPQAVGEVVLVRSEGGAGPDDDLVVQARTAPLGPSRTVSVNTVVAVGAGPDRVTLTLEPAGVVVRVDGEALVLERGEMALPGGGTVWRGPSSRRWAPDSYRVSMADGSGAQVDPIGAAGLRVVARLVGERRGSASGLLGDADGDSGDDLATRDGQVLGWPLSREDLYDTLVESWRVTDAESLFDYGPGESTATVTDRSFPDEVVTAQDLEAGARDRAAELCAAAGVLDPEGLDECVLDVATSGVAAFALAGGQSEHEQVLADGLASSRLTFDATTTTQPLAGDRATVVLTEPGAVARLTFEAEAGAAVLVVLTGGTLPDGCGYVRLFGPGDSQRRTGCVTGGEGLIDRVTLPVAGEHTVELSPSGGAIGRITVHLVRVLDDEQVVEVDGPAVDAGAAVPGAQGLVAFEGPTGEPVVVEVGPASTGRVLPDGCGQVRVLGPDGAVVRSGCLTRGAGRVEVPALEAGRYTVVLDPSGVGTGTASVRVLRSAAAG